MLDYLLSGGESGRERANALGRRAVDDGLGLLQIGRIQSLPRFKASQEFLIEALSPFEMAYRGYVALLEGHPKRSRPSRPARRHRR